MHMAIAATPGMSVANTARMLLYSMDVDTDGKIGRIDRQNAKNARAALTLAGRESMDHKAISRWVSTYDRGPNGHGDGKISKAELNSLNAALAKLEKRQGPLKGPNYEAPTEFPLALAARKFMYGSDANYNGKLDAGDGTDMVNAALKMAGKKTLDQTGLTKWIGTYDGSDESLPNGVIDGTEEKIFFRNVQMMIEHINPKKTSFTLAELAVILIQRSDRNNDGQLSIADATEDRNHDGRITERDLSLQARTIIRMTGATATTATKSSVATMLKNFDLFDARTLKYGVGESDGRIGQLEYPMVEDSAVWVARGILYEDEQADGSS
jgi:hypothetical protein